jgi:hypothetical protein
MVTMSLSHQPDMSPTTNDATSAETINIQGRFAQQKMPPVGNVERNSILVRSVSPPKL